MEKQKLFIGISGKMGTGKSTISNLLRNALENSTISSLAKPLYEAQNLLYNKFELSLEGDKDRDLLIALGLWGRQKHPDFWLGQFAKSAIEDEADIVICDDVRFINEADFFKKHGVLIRLEGDQRGNNVDESKSKDDTECALDSYDFDNVISNKLDPEEMCKKIAEILMGDNKAS